MPRDQRPGARRPPRSALALIVVGVLALAGGYLLGRAGRDTAEPQGSPALTVTPSEEPQPTVTQSSSPEPSPTEGQGTGIEDGKHFVRVTQVVGSGDGTLEVEFDLAYFLTGQEAEEAAKQHGDEVTNGYYIVNDNPKLRHIPLAGDAEVTYVPASACCELQPGDLQAWVDAMNGEVMSDYPDPETSWWWLTVEDGAIVAIEHRWVP